MNTHTHTNLASNKNLKFAKFLAVNAAFALTLLGSAGAAKAAEGNCRASGTISCKTSIVINPSVDRKVHYTAGCYGLEDGKWRLSTNGIVNYRLGTVYPPNTMNYLINPKGQQFKKTYSISQTALSRSPVRSIQAYCPENPAHEVRVNIKTSQ